MDFIFCQHPPPFRKAKNTVKQKNHLAKVNGRSRPAKNGKLLCWFIWQKIEKPSGENKWRKLAKPIRRKMAKSTRKFRQTISPFFCQIKNDQPNSPFFARRFRHVSPDDCTMIFCQMNQLIVMWHRDFFTPFAAGAVVFGIFFSLFVLVSPFIIFVRSVLRNPLSGPNNN